MKKAILILLNFWAALGYSQNITGDTSAVKTRIIASKPPFLLDNYLIDPKKRTVSVYTLVSAGKVGEASTYLPDTSIHYEKTSLIILGEQILFKEQFPFECDFSDLHMMFSNKYGATFRDKNTIYSYSNYNSVTGSKIDASAYKPVADIFYQDKAGDFFCLDDKEFKKITPAKDVNIGNLKHLVNQYFTDKKGLYLFDSHFDKASYSRIYQITKIESSNGKTIRPIVTKNYFIYNNHLYGTLPNGVDKLHMDVNKIIVADWYEDFYMITDGKNLVEGDNNGTHLNDRNFAGDFFSKRNITVQQIIPTTINFVTQKDSCILYLPLGGAKYTHGSSVYRTGMLVKTSDGYYLLDRGMHTEEPQKIKKVLVYNIDTRQDETFNINEFKSFNGMLAYRNHLFIDYEPIKESIDIKKLVSLTKHYRQTNYFTDGKQLIYMGHFTGYSSQKIDGQEFVLLKERIIPIDDISAIKVANDDLLIDANYIYSGTCVIPKNKLGLSLKICIE